MINYTECDDSLIFTVRVVPRSSKSEIVGSHDGAMKVRIAAAPVEGAANLELIKTLARFFDVPKNAVEIVFGETSKTKQVRIAGAGNAKKLSQI